MHLIIESWNDHLENHRKIKERDVHPSHVSQIYLSRKKTKKYKIFQYKIWKKKKEREKEILDVSRAMLFHTAFN